MAVYYKFKSAKDFDSISIDGHFITVGNLKEKIFDIKHLGRGTDFDLMVTNAQTEEEYENEATLIPKNTSVLVRRIPGRPRMNIVTQREEVKVEENKVDEVQPAKSNFPVAESSVMKYSEDTEWGDDFGNDFYTMPEVPQVQSSTPFQDAGTATATTTIDNKADEDSKIKALIDTSALDWQRQSQEGFGMGRGFGRGMGGRLMGGRGFGGRGVFERKTPPQGYICHRCKVPGHFIQHCPTNGDVNYDVKRVKPPTGIPKSMLMATPDGSYALPSGAVAVLKPNEAAFEKEIEGLPSTRSVCDLPPELRCPLCKDVMKDAVLTSKCCFQSFCDKCIRDHIISKSMCICGATNVLADDLLPNRTVRDTINRILESNNSSTENGGSMLLQVQDTESARCAPPKVPSPTASATSKGAGMALSHKDDTTDVKETVNESNPVNVTQQSVEKGRSARTADISEATHESMSVKEQGSAPPAEEEVQQNLPVGEPAKKKKKKKIRVPLNGADLQWRTSQDIAAENYMMSFAPPPSAAYNPYFGMGGGMQLGMDGYMAPYNGAMPYMGGYVPSPFDLSFGGMLPQDPFGGQGYNMMPGVPPQRDLSEFGMGYNPAVAPPVMRREEFEARQAELRRKREMERHVESRERFKDQESGREMRSSGDMSSMRAKPKLVSHPVADTRTDNHHDHYNHNPRDRSERLSSQERYPREVEPVRLSKRKSDHHHHEELAAERAKAAAAADDAEAEMNHKRSVFSRISFPEEEERRKKKNKISSESNGFKDYEHRASSPAATSTRHRPTSNGYSTRDEWKSAPMKGGITVATSSGGGAARRSVMLVDHESSDDEERHFKRRRSRYEPSPAVEVEDELVVRSKRRSSREERDHRGREHDRDHHHRHR